MKLMKKTLCLLLILASFCGAIGGFSAAGASLPAPFLLGDADGDGKINISDVTLIQQALASLATIEAKNKYAADTDEDGESTVVDAWLIQRYLAKFSMSYRVGKTIDLSQEQIVDDSPFKPIKGVDVSYANGDVNMQKIKDAGFEFVMIRCGYGGDKVSQDDSQYENNVKKAEKLKMPWGTYLYSYALTVADAKSEASHTLRLLKGKKPTMPVAFDMEDGDGYKAKHGFPSNITLVNICKTYLSLIEDAGYYPILYTGLYWIKGYLNDPTLIDRYDIWLAQWYTKPEYTGDNLGMWQYGGETNFLESNSIAGVGTIDKNYCYKNYPAIIKNNGYNGWAMVGYNQIEAADPDTSYFDELAETAAENNTETVAPEADASAETDSAQSAID